MSPETQTLTDLKDLRAATQPVAAATAALTEPKLDKQGRAYATGKRKNAVARVWIKPGSGRMTVNGRDLAVYFARPVLRMLISQPFALCNRLNQFDVSCSVSGGGLSGQRRLERMRRAPPHLRR